MDLSLSKREEFFCRETERGHITLAIFRLLRKSSYQRRSITGAERHELARLLGQVPGT